MIKGKAKCLVALFFVVVLSFISFVSYVKKDLIFDADGLKVAAMVIFVLSADIFIYVYKKLE